MRKKITAFILALVLALSLVPTALANFAGIAKASTQSVEVDGAKIEFQMYALVDANGGLTNYVKLRDVAHVLNSTPAKFSVGYDGVISIVTGESYTDNGSEMTTPFSGDRAYKPGPGAVKVNGADVNLDAIVLTDDNGGAYTYFKLRDLGTALGFKVDWTSQRGVFIETGAAPSQTQPQTTPPAASQALTLEDFQGIWEFIPGPDEYEYSRALIISGDRFEQYGVGDNYTWYADGKVVLQKDVESRYVGHLPYMFDLHAETKLVKGKVNTDNLYMTFGIKEVDIAAGYLKDRDDHYYYKVDTSTVKARARQIEPVLSNYPANTGSSSQPTQSAADAENYAYRALDYIYNSLKFPSTMQDVSIRVGPYSRAGLSSAIYSTTDEYYVVTISCKAANSFGTLTYDTYVCLFDLTTGKTVYDWEASTDRSMQHAMGAAMINLLSIKNEILALKGQGSLLTPLSRETVDKLVARVKGQWLT